ncbi:MAG: hypothetical protein R2747_22115 [Pyrinomonadaceae bacterium]
MVIVVSLLFGLAMSFIRPPDGAIAVLLVATVSLPILFIIRNYSEDKKFLTNIFLIALLARLSFGLIIQIFDLRMFIAEDSGLYNAVGQRLVEIWQGLMVPNDNITFRASQTSGPGWGMHYLVGAIYFICGQSLLVAQSFCAVIGAATAPMVYFCSRKIYDNRRVAKIAAIGIAVFPSFIIWSSQLLKDGLIIFLLVLAMIMVLQLQEKFNFPAILILLFSLFGIFSLRFYIFYMVAFAVAGSFVIGLSTSATSIIRRTMVIALLGLSLTYLGVIRNAGAELQKYGDLETLQRSRQDLADSAGSGFGENLDVSTPTGVLVAMPVGLAYLMLAPFPWQMNNFRQLGTLPEVLAWWAMIPLMFSGLWYTLKTRLRKAIPVLIFSLMLTMAYSIFQGNVGTAYRQRTQIQVFLFMFIGVGWTLYLERKENRRNVELASQRNFERMLREHGQLEGIPKEEI